MDDKKLEYDSKEYWKREAERLAVESANLLITIKEMAIIIASMEKNRRQ